MGEPGLAAETDARKQAVLRVARAVVALAITIALVAQYVNGADRNNLSAVNFLSYFTVLSNMAAAVLFAVEVWRPSLMDTPRFALVRGAVALYMIMTGIVYNVLLAPKSADVGLTLPWVDFIVHTAAPLAFLIDWIIDPPEVRPSLRAAALWLVFPAVYLVYSLARGPIANWYPYPFLDPDANGGTGGVTASCVGILAAFVLVGLGLRWWSGRAASRVERPEALA
jgi:hypothetical protein